jgi:hypothetical protein
MFEIRLKGSIPPDDIYKDIATKANTRPCRICEGKPPSSKSIEN